MSRTTHIPFRIQALVYAFALATLGLCIAMLAADDLNRWPLAAVLAVAGVGLAIDRPRMSRFTTVAMGEFPLMAALLLLQPGLVVAVALFVGAVPKGRYGLVSRTTNAVIFALPIALASTVFAALRTHLGIDEPSDGPLIWFLVAVVSLMIDTAGHYALGGLWQRLVRGFPLREWMRDVVLPFLKNDPITAILLAALVEVALLLHGTARILPISLAIAGTAGTWMTLKATSRQVEARDLKDDFFRAIFVSLARLLQMKDPDTAFHSARVAIFARDIAEVMELSEQEQGRIHLAGLLHDVGKVGVPDEILLKPGRLTDRERSIMERHARLSAEAIQGIPGFGDLVRAVYAHHERIDGSGYPEGIGGDQLPTGARILGVADTFEALTSDRPYRRGRSAIEALEVFDREIELFDPQVVNALRTLVLSGRTDHAFTTLTDFSDEWSRAARHLEVRMDEEPFILPPEKAPPAILLDPVQDPAQDPAQPAPVDSARAGAILVP